jgi:predicted transcriptional regulator
MATLTIELPDELAAELKARQIREDAICQIVVQAIEDWLRRLDVGSAPTTENANERSSPFAESAIPFIDQLIDENRSLFDRLAQCSDATEFARRVIANNRKLFEELARL